MLLGVCNLAAEVWDNGCGGCVNGGSGGGAGGAGCGRWGLTAVVMKGCWWLWCRFGCVEVVN